MSAENKKVLWIAISVCAFVLVLAGLGLILTVPQKNGARAPATVGNTAPPKASDPQDFLAVQPPPLDGQGHNKEGDIIVIYGEKPQSLEPTTALPGNAESSVLPANDTTNGYAAGSSTPPDLGAKPAGQAAAPAKPTAPPVATAPASPAAPKAATSGQASSSKPTAAKTPAKAAPPAKKLVDEYWIQAASFSSRGKADDMKEGLALKGMAALITVKDISGKSFYRVRIGPYSSQAEADGWLAKIKKLPGCEEAGIWKTSVEKK